MQDNCVGWRHLLSDTRKTNVNLVIQCLNFVKCRRGDCCSRRKALSGPYLRFPISNLLFTSLNRIDLGIGKKVGFILRFPDGIMFFFWVFDRQFLKVPLRLQFL